MIRCRLPLRYIYIVASIFAYGVSGCTRRIPVATVILVDPSGSVTPRARQDEFAAVAVLIPKMQRGDSLTIIPITDNAAADIQGRVLRLRAPSRREAYDADLRRFSTEAGRQYSAFAANFLAHPGMRTDILGALDVARQEIAGIPDTDRRRLIVLSDFFEDDGRYRFSLDRNLKDAADARILANCLASEHQFVLHGARIYLCTLESGDFARLEPSRQTAVRTFWSAYFARTGRHEEVQLDGLEMLEHLPE
jgi:hypothetical protein